MKKTLTLSIVFSAMALSGCSTIVTGGEDLVTIDTLSNDSEVRVDGEIRGKGKVTTGLDKSNTHTLSAHKENCKSASVQTEQTIEPWFFGNLIIGGIVGMIVDAATGNANKVSDDEYLLIPVCNRNIEK